MSPARVLYVDEAGAFYVTLYGDVIDGPFPTLHDAELRLIRLQDTARHLADMLERRWADA